jgi:hypothetical protein
MATNNGTTVQCSEVLDTGYANNCLNGRGGVYENEVYIQVFDAVSATSVSSTGIITGVTMSGTAKFVQIKQLKYAAANEEAFNVDPETGTLSYTVTAKFKMNRKTTTSRNMVEKYSNKPCVLLMREKATGSYWMFGDDLGLYVDKASKGTSGQKINEFNGFDMVFIGDSTYMAREVSSSIISSIVTLA